MNLKIIILVLALFFFLFGCTKTTPSEIKLGAVLELTGTGTLDQGQSAANGIRLAVEEENAKGGIEGKKISLILENSACENTTGANAAKKLLEIDRVQAIIGDICDGVTATIVPLAKQSHILLITPGSTAKQLTQVGAPTTLRTWFTEDQLARKTVEQMVKTGHKKIAIIYMDNAWGEAQANAIQQEAQKKGLTFEMERVQPDNTDFRGLLEKIEAKNPDAYYLGLNPQGTVSILSQMKNKQISKQVYAHGGLVGSTINQGIDQGLLEGVIASFVGDSNAEFVSNYTNKFGSTPGITADSAYDAAKLIILAIRETKSTDSEILAAHIKEIKGYNGASGTLNFDENGEAGRPIFSYRVENNKLVKIE